jgi:hypothetical protein
LSIVMHGLALNITVQTYAGRVDFGLIADKKAVPHLQDLADALEAAFRQAQALLAPAPEAQPALTPAAPKSAPRRAAPRKRPARARKTSSPAAPTRRKAA